MRSRPNKTCQTDMHIIKYFHTPNKDYILHIVLEKKTKYQKLNVGQGLISTTMLDTSISFPLLFNKISSFDLDGSASRCDSGWIG